MAPKTQVDLLRVLEQREVRRLGGEDADPARRAAGGRDPPGRRRAGRRGQAPRGPVLPPQRRAPARASPPRAARRHPPARRAFPASGPARGIGASPSRSPGRRCASSATTRGRGTSASCGTASNGWWSTSEGPVIHAEDLPKEMRTPPRAGRPEPRRGGPGDGEGRHPRGPGPVRQPPRAHGPAPGHQRPHPALQDEPLLAPVAPPSRPGKTSPPTGKLLPLRGWSAQARGGARRHRFRASSH